MKGARLGTGAAQRAERPILIERAFASKSRQIIRVLSETRRTGTMLEAPRDWRPAVNALPEVVPPKVPEFGHESIAEISVIGGSLTLWGLQTLQETGPKVALRLDLDASIIVGRQEGGRIPYMDPAYQSTQIGPDGQSVLTHNGHGRDICVSRGHFMLRSSPYGILFVNGVPRGGGGTRPPVNGTYLVAPTARWLAPSEEFVVERGQYIKIRLPN